MRHLSWIGLMLVVCIAHSLHTQETKVRVTGYNMKAELERLEAQQSAFEAAVDRLTKSADSNIARLTQSSNDTQKVFLLQDSILKERQELFNISTKILPPFNISKCSCENLTDKEKVLMLSDLDIVKKNVLEVQATLSKVGRCDKIDAINRDIEKQLFFVQSMQDILYAKCLKVMILTATIFQTNLYVDNWVLGDQSADEVVDEYYQRSRRYQNVTNCPISRPFFVGTQCVTCPEPTPVFNLLQRRCVSCGPGGFVDTTTRRCSRKNVSLKTNYEAPNYSLDGLNEIPPSPPGAVQTCPLEKPFFNGIECISCPPGSFFSVPNVFCKNCPPGTFFDTVRKSCTNGEPVAVIDISRNYSTNFEAGKFIVTSSKGLGEYRQEQQQRISSSPLVEICPLETPYFNGVSCISCNRDPYIYFNLDTRKCTTCPRGSSYDSSSNKCFATTTITTVRTAPLVTTTTRIVSTTRDNNRYLSNLQNNLWVTNDGNVSKVFQFNRDFRSSHPNTPVCPIETPFYDGEGCISCPIYFNFDSKQCEGCPSKTVFNPNLHVCESSQFSSVSPFQTNPLQAPNLIYDGISSEQYKHTYEANIANNPNISDCGPSLPYWNGKQCISCSVAVPYFNLGAKVCQNCSPGSTYNPVTKECEDRNGKYINQGPTIEKLIAGIM